MMNEIETKHGAVRVYSGRDSVYLKTRGHTEPPGKVPGPRLSDGWRVRLSADEARIIAKALLRSVADAEQYVELQKTIGKRHKAVGPVSRVDWDDLPAFRRLDPAVEASNARREAALMQKERESVERLRAEIKQKRRGKRSKAAEQILGPDPLARKPSEPLN